MTSRMGIINPEIDKYCESLSSTSTGLLSELADHTRKSNPRAAMLTGALEGSFLTTMIHLLGVKRVLEFGTFTGYSALTMAEALPADGEVVTLDVDSETNKLARSYWDRSPHGKKIKPILAPALETVKTLSGTFDLVFIDADKTNYLNYLKASLPLLSPNGLVLADNCLWRGLVLDENDQTPDTKAIREFNDWVKKNPELEGTLLPLRDGVFMIRKR